MQAAKPIYGTYYTDLYKLGWFNNPKVCEVFLVAHDQEPYKRQRQIKDILYRDLGTDSLAKVDPVLFARYCQHKGLRLTLPASLREPLG